MIEHVHGLRLPLKRRQWREAPTEPAHNDDPLQSWLQKIGQIPLLTSEQELLAAHVAPYGAQPVRFLGVLYKLVVAPEPRVAFLAFGFLVVEKAHGYDAKRWLLSWIIK